MNKFDTFTWSDSNKPAQLDFRAFQLREILRKYYFKKDDVPRWQTELAIILKIRARQRKALYDALPA